MKRKLLLLNMLSLGLFSMSNAQEVSKIAHHGAVNPAVTHHNNATKGALIYGEDFSGGIPTSWTDSTYTGPVDWKYTTVGHTGDYPTQSLLSSTANNGWMIIDSDADNFDGGGAEDARLTTHFIDCSAYANVKIEFQQMFRRWQQDVTTVRVSVDSGYTWTDFVINQAVTQSGTDNPDYVNIDISSAIASNPDSVLIQFWWQGAWDYGWQIDDFAVKELDPNDLLIKRTSLSEDVTYYQVPESQIQALNFSAFAENVGLASQTNVVLNVDVNDGGSNVFNGSSSPLANLASGSSDSLFLTSTYTPSGIGSYDVTMTVDQSETDDEIGNNSTVLNFAVTDTVYAIDNGIYGGEWWNLDDGAGSSNAYEIGAVYEVVADEWASSSSVYIGASSTVGAYFNVNIYEFNTGTGAYDFIIGTDDYTVDNADLDNWVTLRFPNDIELTAGTDYLVTVIFYGGSEALYIGYGTNSSFSGATVSNDGDGSGTWSGQPRTPMIRLNLGEVGLAIEENDNEVGVYPNPTTGLLNVEFSGAELIEVNVYDLTGKLVKESNLSTFSISTLSMGMYILEVVTSEGISKQRITKE